MACFLSGDWFGWMPGMWGGPFLGGWIFVLLAAGFAYRVLSAGFNP